MRTRVDQRSPSRRLSCGATYGAGLLASRALDALCMWVMWAAPTRTARQQRFSNQEMRGTVGLGMPR